MFAGDVKLNVMANDNYGRTIIIILHYSSLNRPAVPIIIIKDRVTGVIIIMSIIKHQVKMDPKLHKALLRKARLKFMKHDIPDCCLSPMITASPLIVEHRDVISVVVLDPSFVMECTPLLSDQYNEVFHSAIACKLLDT